MYVCMYLVVLLMTLGFTVMRWATDGLGLHSAEAVLITPDTHNLAADSESECLIAENGPNSSKESYRGPNETIWQIT